MQTTINEQPNRRITDMLPEITVNYQHLFELDGKCLHCGKPTKKLFCNLSHFSDWAKKAKL